MLLYIANVINYNFSAHGQLTVRLLLEINETCLRSQGFFDLWKQQKKFENNGALATLSARLAEIDAIPEDRQRWIELCRGVLAGTLYKIQLYIICTFFMVGIILNLEAFLGIMYYQSFQLLRIIEQQARVSEIYDLYINLFIFKYHGLINITSLSYQY